MGGWLVFRLWQAGRRLSRVWSRKAGGCSEFGVKVVDGRKAAFIFVSPVNSMGGLLYTSSQVGGINQ